MPEVDEGSDKAAHGIPHLGGGGCKEPTTHQRHAGGGGCGGQEAVDEGLKEKRGIQRQNQTLGDNIKGLLKTLRRFQVDAILKGNE